MKTLIKSSLTFLKKLDVQRYLFSKDALAIFFFISLLSFSYCLFSLYKFNTSKKQIKGQLESIYANIKNIACDNATKEEYGQILKGADSRYLFHSIESRHPFLRESELLEEVLSFSAFKTNKAIQNRLNELRKSDQQFILVKKNSKNLFPVCEVLYALKAPLYVNTSDVKGLLSRIEGVNIEEEKPLRGRPDLFFKRFELKKGQDKEGQEQYELFFEILSREKGSS